MPHLGRLAVHLHSSDVVLRERLQQSFRITAFIAAMVITSAMPVRAQTGRVAGRVLNGTIDLVFWESVATVPAGTHVVGVTIHDCGPGLSTIVSPPRQAAKLKADEFRRDFNCGLALIRLNGVMASICASSTHPGGDPHRILDGPAPTVQCLADNAR
jgi:hypothetical protein